MRKRFSFYVSVVLVNFDFQSTKKNQSLIIGDDPMAMHVPFRFNSVFDIKNVHI